jgi:putative oxygen-independent coproporphyrinogen III oxidase
MTTTANEPAGLYVHVPFCRQKCRYCDFYSIPSSSLVTEWLQAVDQEATLYKDRFSLFDTLYLGGGTPTLLAMDEMARLVGILRGHFSFCPDGEISLEANPNDVTLEKLLFFRDLGFNRISLGVQSMDDRELAFLGRRHTARQAAYAMERIRESGFPGFGVDLIFGLPGQTEAEWRRTLQKTLAFSPDHISCYQLTVSEGTPLWKMCEAGLFTMPDEERERSLFLTTSEVLEGRGFAHYEVSNYARMPESGPQEASGKNPLVCRHNVKYWERTPYLGLGPSAHSFQGDTRWWNHRSVRKYCQDLNRGRRPVQGSERLSDEQAELERLSLQLRTKAGTAIRDLRDYEKADRVLPGLLEAGLLEVIGERAVPTREGFLVADRLPLLFL